MGGGSFAGGGGFGGGASGGYGGGMQGGFGGGGMGGAGFMGVGSQLGPRLGGGPTMSATMLRGGAFTGLQDTVRVVADDINNTLIIQASQADYAYLSETIKKLDVLPRQAIIDARIFEVDLNDQLSFGVAASLQARTTDPHLTTAGIGATGALTAGTFAFVGNSREILANINALRSKTKVRILEAPSVLALDGTMAQIVVGGEVPYRGASYISGAGGATSSVQYRDTGVSLIVMPRISGSGTVTLQIAQEISSPGSNDPNLGPTFNKTSVSTTLAVKDGETVAIAGLIRTSDSNARSGVPFLSEIPLLGALFGQTNRTAIRSEVLILITPHVIRTPERFQEMTQELQDSLRNVRKVVGKSEQDNLRDLENAQKERNRREEKEEKKSPPPAEKPKN
jgi:general secretion pathway protein D